MFILRKITGNGGELNFALGDSYSLILKDTNPKEFKEVLSLGGHSAFEDDLYGFITYGDCQHQMLFKKQFNYIMTENGKTFKNITSHDRILSKSKPGMSTVSGYLYAMELPNSLKDKPARDENADHSIDLLIDVDGSNECFRVGYYLFGVERDEDGFVLYDKSEQVYPAMKWDYLPLKKK